MTPAGLDNIKRLLESRTAPAVGMTTTPSMPNPQGLVQPGNIDLLTRPRVYNGDGTYSTVKSISMGDDQGREVLLPLVQDDGRVLDEKNPAHIRQIWDQYLKSGKHLGMFNSPDAATAYAQQLHGDYANGAIPGYPPAKR